MVVPPERPFELASSPLAQGPARYRVLYVEDNPSSAALMRDLVEELAAIELVVAPTAEEGLLLVAERPFDLVLLDINLPGMSGFEAAARLRASPATAALPLVGVSAAALSSDTTRAREVGFDGYLTKPIQLVELAAKLVTLLN
jgi:CheY-like chemotaxis protein